ncbi:uncharacterized protein EpC_34310 [Erwinia pyrifoliae Ep1/96]|nr:uncharacterized protein EpC_34310 [Erwinia pyrifoliae Ep1/96]
MKCKHPFTNKDILINKFCELHLVFYLRIGIFYKKPHNKEGALFMLLINSLLPLYSLFNGILLNNCSE